MCNSSHNSHRQLSFARSLVLQELIIITTIYMMSGLFQTFISFEFIVFGFTALILWCGAADAVDVPMLLAVWYAENSISLFQ